MRGKTALAEVVSAHPGRYAGFASAPLFSADCRRNDTADAPSWFDEAAIDEETRQLVGRDDARRLLRLNGCPGAPRR